MQAIALLEYVGLMALKRRQSMPVLDEFPNGKFGSNITQ